MTKHDRIMGLAAAIAGLGLIGAVANAQPTEPPDLRKKVEALEEEVRQLRSEHAITPAYSIRDVDAVVAAVQADANGRSLAVPHGGSAGHDLQKGFYIKSDDGNFTLYPDLFVQFRGIVNYRENGKRSSESTTESGFELRRAKIGFSGTAFSPDLTYRFLWQDAVIGGGLSLQYGYAQYVFARGVAGGDLAVRAGQFKNIVFKEEFTPDRAQLFAERSLANALLGGAALGSETQGVDVLLIGANNPLHVDLLFDDGIRSSNTDFRDNQPLTVGTATTNVATDFGVAGRVDYKVFGKWRDADDLTGVEGRDDLLVIGGGVDYSQGDNNTTVHYTADVQYQFRRKLVLLAALYGNEVDLRNTSAGPSGRSDWGVQVEAGYFITPALQATARYSLVKLDSDFKTGGADTFHEIAGGLNWFFGKDGELGNRAKLTLDVNYLPNGSPALPGLEYLANPNKKDEVVVRTQLQFSL
jgi:hypothetical protein